MKRKPFAALLAIAACAGFLSAQEEESLLQISGSILSESGYVAIREDIPDEAARDWYSTTSAVARVSRDGENASFHSALWTQYDGASGEWALSLDEAWGEWRPQSFLALKLGRARLNYGSCVAFNPANSLVGKDSFDSRSNMVGLDGLAVEFHPLETTEKGRNLPVSLAVNAAFLLPAASTTADDPLDIGESGAHGRITLFMPGAGPLGPTEIGFSGDFRPLGGDTPDGDNPAAGGTWLSADVGGFVLGAEGTLKTHEYGYAFSVNHKLGDFLAVLETQYRSPDESWQGFGQVSWSKGDAEISLSGLIDFGTFAARTSIDAAWNATDFLVLHANAGWNRLPEKWEPALAYDYTAGLAAECFF